MKVRTQYNESGDWVLPPYSKPIICHHSFVTFICQRKSFGIFTSWGGAPRMASRMVSCSWWTLSLLRMLNIPGELNFHRHSLICFHPQAKPRVWSSRCLETWNGRWLGRAALLLRQDQQTSYHSRLHKNPHKTFCFHFFVLPFLTTILILEYACSFVLSDIFNPSNAVALIHVMCERDR